MLKTIILRFSDYEYATIAAHKEMITTEKSVWWGWWRKSHEPPQTEVLREISKKCPIEIGLVNRVCKGISPECYTVICTKIVFDANGERVQSPELNRTPNYYRDSKHPAWFELLSISEPLQQELFIKRFGGIPRGDPTLFVVEEKTSGDIIVQDHSIEQPMIVDTKGDSILHISDLHFGADHGFNVEMQRDGIRKALADIISHRIKALADCNIGVIVLSGDIVTKSDANAYVHAQVFLEVLLKNLGLEEKHVLIVPGNHDIWPQKAEYPTRTYNYEEPYRFFLRGFYCTDIREIERFCSYCLRSEWQLNILGLNSAHLRTHDTMDFGYVGVDRYGPFLNALDEYNKHKNMQELSKEKILNFVVLHHHLLPSLLVYDPPKKSRQISVTLDAGQLVADLQKASVHFVIHGHQHVPFLGSTARARRSANNWVGYKQPLFVIGIGSTGAVGSRLHAEMRNNTYGIYTPQAEGLRIRIEEFTVAMGPRTYMDVVIPYA